MVWPNFVPLLAPGSAATPVLAKDSNVLMSSVVIPQVGYGSCLASLNAVTGAQIWNSGCSNGGLIFDNHGAVVSLNDGAIFLSIGNAALALEADGTRRWIFFPCGVCTFTTPVISFDGSTVFVGSSASIYTPALLYALNASTGAVLWTLRSPAAITGLALVPGVGVAFSSVGSYLRLVSASGAQLWATPYLAFGWPAEAPSAPALTPAGALLTVSSQGIFSFNVTTGAATPVGSVPAGIAAWPAGSVPVVDASAARLYVSMPAGASAPGEVRAYAL